MKVNYTLVCAVPGTSYPISTIKVGQSFNLLMYVQDLRKSGQYFNPNFGREVEKIRGVFAAYADIPYNTNLVKPDFNVLVFSPKYPNGQSGSDQFGCINELGGFSASFSGLSTAKLLVCRIKLTALNVGTQIFTPKFDMLDRPSHDTLVYGNIACDPPEESWVDPTEISVVSSTLNIIQ